MKGKLSLVLYAAAIPLAFVNQWIADAHLRVRRADVAGAGSADRDAAQPLGSAPRQQIADLLQQHFRLARQRRRRHLGRLANA